LLKGNFQIELYELIRRGRSDPLGVLGVFFLHDGQVVNNPEAPLIKDIDDLQEDTWRDIICSIIVDND
jgi:hypothetical protein